MTTAQSDLEAEVRQLREHVGVLADALARIAHALDEAPEQESMLPPAAFASRNALHLLARLPYNLPLRSAIYGVLAVSGRPLPEGVEPDGYAVPDERLPRDEWTHTQGRSTATSRPWHIRAGPVLLRSGGQRLAALQLGPEGHVGVVSQGAQLLLQLLTHSYSVRSTGLPAVVPGARPGVGISRGLGPVRRTR